MNGAVARGMICAAALALGVAAVAEARALGVRSTGVASVNRANVGNRTVVNNNVHVGNNNVNIDVDRGWDYGRHPVAAGVAFGTAAAVARAAVGSMIYSLPPACGVRPYGGYSYYSCGGVWYAPQYQGDSVVYVVVNEPGH